MTHALERGRCLYAGPPCPHVGEVATIRGRDGVARFALCATHARELAALFDDARPREAWPRADESVYVGPPPPSEDLGHARGNRSEAAATPPRHPRGTC